MRYAIIVIPKYMPRHYVKCWLYANGITEEGRRVTRIIRQQDPSCECMLRGAYIVDADIYYLHTVPEACSMVATELAIRIRRGGDIKIHIIKEEVNRNET